jgi:hypothetical protein
MVFDRLSNDNEIVWNLKHYQNISKRTYLYFFLFSDFFFYILYKKRVQDGINQEPKQMIKSIK